MDVQISDFLALPATGAAAPALAVAVEMPHVLAVPALAAAPALEAPAVAVALPHAVAVAPKTAQSHYATFFCTLARWRF